MTFADKLSQLSQSYESSEATTGGSRAPLPDGKYQSTITKVHLATVKKGKLQGSVRVEFHGKILTGEFKGYPTWRGVNLEMQAKGNMPSGVSLLKGDLQTLGADLKSLDEPSLLKVFKGLIGQNVEISASTREGWTNIYFNQLIGDINLKTPDLDPAPVADMFAEDAAEEMDTSPEAKPTPKRRGPAKKSKGKKDIEVTITTESVATAVGAVDESDEFGDSDWGND